MIEKIIGFSVSNKLIIFLFVFAWIGWGLYSITQIPIGAVPDVTNNQVQVITTSRNLSTQDIEQFITYPVELEMANLPGVTEIRSISKFGLSVVTVVFSDDMGTYLPRQLISERLKSAEERIPEGFGTPQMGPITTGLGEIYQYILDVKPEFKDKYTIMDLRTIQDWIVKRYMSGIPGVVEVNTWGGYLKQYEVSVDPQKLRGMDISIGEIFTALQFNNDVTGGAYIEKSNQSYFLRGEGMITSIDDIASIVVTQKEGIPVLVKDVANVRLGYAPRFGAITGNGEGEKVMGQVMMLKDANSNEVIRNVKERVQQIQQTLPEGVYINPFLERTELIEKTSFTVLENLTLGALIVIFVLVLLLGNLRSGIIVASVIPLSLLFGISMMSLFGISANLMSLGAIDFGIIIDGAVIIMEFIVFRFNQESELTSTTSAVEYQKIKDKITIESTIRMMKPAFFGQIIILIVFIPILSLKGIEGKMFTPMAISFSFALIGAMILSLTYVPVMASIFGKSTGKDKGISSKILNGIQRIYNPVIEWALENKSPVFLAAVAFLASSVFLFSRMGGEFIPTLDEGDYVVQPVLKTGTSLGKTIELMTQLEQILIESFPEVEQVVSRIGAAEIPTDPMSMEETDVIIKLKPKNEWVSAGNKEELADKMKLAMSEIPGIDFEFTQPIEMRFNELVTGIRSDLAIKIFGEDLDELQELGNHVRQLISGIPGAADVIVEKVAGLPQMKVKYDRKKIASYGLNIKSLNRVLRMAFAGESTGLVVEGERRFDLVVRLEPKFRTDITNLRKLYIELPTKDYIPLEEVADITFDEGPAKISRDNTKRRIVIGINVRNRDVESLVNEIQDILKDNLVLPPGYTVSYGGQFENLQRAKSRLMVAVPIALILIFILLRFTFGSFRQALMVYTAIPLSAIGGVWLLWIRGLPFSISAGIGFIALFGIAVLNGIVLIEFFNELESKGVKSIKQRVLTGTRMRLRPVLITASAAALGFIPMAFSSSAGAEVQRPLATVVIGGLITATLLTLIVLPVVYLNFHKEKIGKMEKKPSQNPGVKGKFLSVLLILLIFIVLPAHSQKKLSLDQAIQLARQNNEELKSYNLRIHQRELLEKRVYEFDKTNFYQSYDENNIAEDGYALNVFGIQQSLKLPPVYSIKKKINQQFTGLAINAFEKKRWDLDRSVTLSYFDLVYRINRLKLLENIDSLYKHFAYAAKRRHEEGETGYLERLTAETKSSELGTERMQAELEVHESKLKLKALLQIDDPILLEAQNLIPLEYDSAEVWVGLNQHPDVIDGMQRSTISNLQIRNAKSNWWPELNLEYFNGFSRGTSGLSFTGYQIGIGLPLLFSNQTTKIQALKVEHEITNAELSYRKIQIESSYFIGLNKIKKYEETLAFYENQGLSMASELIEIANKSFENGETDYLQFIQSIESAIQLRLKYLENLSSYNQAVIEFNYLRLL